MVSVCSLASTLYEGDKHSNENGEVVARKHVCFSVAVLNLLLCPLGALPVCHGAGGLAGQHHFGARHGAAVVILGVAKILLAASLGNWLVTWVETIPLSILAVLLVLAGLELAVTGLRLISSTKGDQMAALTTVVCSLGWHATHLGAIAGWVVHWLLLDRHDGEISYEHVAQSSESEDCTDGIGMQELNEVTTL